MENEKEVIVDLVFTKDFSILVKNNIERGMATINIRGIGKYKGQVIATFYID
jgi:hypothetical protein